MTQFAMAWRLCRGRFVSELEGLSQAQLNWRIYPGALTIGEMALHVAGVEISFISQLTGTDLDAFQTRLKSAATEGVVNENPFPFPPAEITPETVRHALEVAESMTAPVIDHPSEELLRIEIKSALGPMITGEGALTRFAFHPGYHQGQAYQIRSSPGFPS
jgi:hypothetical protein